MSTAREARITALRTDYATLHETAMRRINRARQLGGDVYLDDLQRREIEIDRELRAMGTRLGA